MMDLVHLSFVGGGIFLPNEGPADRQDLVDYVAHLLHSRPAVQIRRSAQQWMAEQCADCCHCACCGRATKAVCYERTNAAEAYCLRCALETEGHRFDEDGNATGVGQLGNVSSRTLTPPRRTSLTAGVAGN